MIEDDLPKRGIQSYYFHFPLVIDFFQQHYQQLLTQSTTSTHLGSTAIGAPPLSATTDKNNKKSSFSHIFLTIIKELRYEVFYAWPLSSIFHQSFLTSLHEIHSYLLSLQIMKWFGEFYWKSIISSNSMNIEYNFNHQMIQEKKNQQKATDTMKKKSSTSRDNIDRVPSNDGDDEGDNHRDNNNNEKEIERTATVMKEIIHIYDIERDIYFSKRQIQLQLIYLISLIKSLYDYTLTYIHEFLWKELESKLFSSSQQQQSKWRETTTETNHGNNQERKVTVVMIRYYLEEMISSIQSFLSIFQEKMMNLLPKILQCFHELHVTLLFENVYRLQQEEEAKEKKKQGNNPPKKENDPAKKTQQIISKNERLIKFRQLEMLFEEMKKQMKDIYQIIRDHADPRRYSRQQHPSNRSGILQEHQKKVNLYQMKLFEEMNQRLNY